MAGIAASVLAGGLVLTAQGGSDPQAIVNKAFDQFKALKEGKNADYIPALAKVDPNLFGIALITVDGKVYTAGDIKTEVSIQSISKVFTMAQVIQEQGLESVEKRIGVDATGARFNSIIAIEGRQDGRRHRRPGNESSGESRRDLGDQHGDRRQRRCGLEEDHRHLQRLRRASADGPAGRVQVGVRLQPAQPGDRRADARLRLHQDQLAAGCRSLHAPVLGGRERQGSRR